MKLTLILFLVLASVAVFKAEETSEDVEEQPSLTDVYDGTLEDEVLGNEDDPADMKKKRHMARNFKHMRICGGVFVKCLKKTQARCKFVPVCRAQYYACRCILKGVDKCKRFLGWVRAMRRKAKKYSRKHDDIEEDESEDALKKKGKWNGIVRKCKAGYGRCSKGKKFCGPCLKQFGSCVKKHFIAHVCKAHGHSKGDEPMDEEEDEETAMANVAEHDDTEEHEQLADESEDALKHKKPSQAMIRCGKRGVKCMLRAKLNCRRQGRCMRSLMRCVRRAKRT